MPTPPPAYHWSTIHPNATVHYVREFLDADSLIEALGGPVGFDLEWKPTFTKGTPENPVAIVQLANEHTILVLQVSAMKQFPTKLKDFLENPDIVKAGVGIQNDAKKLYKDWQVSTHNCVDLSLLARCADNAQWKGKYNAPLGLARLVEAYESRVLPKGKISRSNWEDDLTPSQVDYAANDAHAGFVLYQRLLIMANAMIKVPKPVYYSFNIVRGFLCEPGGMHWNSHNPDYDPGPPPPPPQPHNAQYIRSVRPRAAAHLRDMDGSTSDPALPQGLTSASSASPRSAQIASSWGSIRQRKDSLPDYSEKQGSSVVPPTSPRSTQIDFLRKSTQRRADSLSRLNSRDARSLSPKPSRQSQL